MNEDGIFETLTDIPVKGIVCSRISLCLSYYYPELNLTAGCFTYVSTMHFWLIKEFYLTLELCINLEWHQWRPSISLCSQKNMLNKLQMKPRALISKGMQWTFHPLDGHSATNSVYLAFLN